MRRRDRPSRVSLDRRRPHLDFLAVPDDQVLAVVAGPADAHTRRDLQAGPAVGPGDRDLLGAGESWTEHVSANSCSRDYP